MKNRTTTMTSSTISPNDIVTYYDDCEIDYRWLWYLNDQSAMHYGYWKDDTEELGAALQNMNAYVIDRLDVKTGDHILDAGCGVGGTSRYVAQRFDVKVHGITLSQNQVSKAKENAKKVTLKGEVDFSVQDYCNTNFPNETFNGIYAIESVCHATEKGDFLKEAYRQLKPGGSLVVAGFFMNGEMQNEKDAELMANWADTWAVPAFEPAESFLAKARKQGFEVIEENEITDSIYKSARRLYRCFFPGVVAHAFLRLIGLRNKVQGKNVWSCYYQFKSMKKALWQYRVFKFTKSL